MKNESIQEVLFLSLLLWSGLLASCAHRASTFTPTPVPTLALLTPTERGGRFQASTPVGAPAVTPLLSEEESQKIALEFLKSSPTFRFDGIGSTLKLVSATVLEKPFSWQFEYEFKSRHAGYGDRTGKILAQVIIPHRARIVVQEGEVVYAVLDGKWDMLRQLTF